MNQAKMGQGEIDLSAWCHPHFMQYEIYTSQSNAIAAELSKVVDQFNSTNKYMHPELRAEYVAIMDDMRAFIERTDKWAEESKKKYDECVKARGGSDPFPVQRHGVVKNVVLAGVVVACGYLATL